jgi:DNA repair ATPase RecN
VGAGEQRVAEGLDFPGDRLQQRRARPAVRRREDLERARGSDRELALERDRLQWQADELSQVAPVPGEWEELAAEQKRLAHAASLLEGARGIADALSEADDALTARLHQAIQKLRKTRR